MCPCKKPHTVAFLLVCVCVCVRACCGQEQLQLKQAMYDEAHDTLQHLKGQYEEQKNKVSACACVKSGSLKTETTHTHAREQRHTHARTTKQTRGDVPACMAVLAVLAVSFEQVEALEREVEALQARPQQQQQQQQQQHQQQRQRQGDDALLIGQQMEAVDLGNGEEHVLNQQQKQQQQQQQQLNKVEPLCLREEGGCRASCCAVLCRALCAPR